MVPLTKLKNTNDVKIVLHIGLKSLSSNSSDPVTFVVNTLQTIKKTIPQNDSWEISQEILIFLIPLMNFLFTLFKVNRVNRQIDDIVNVARPGQAGYQQVPTAPTAPPQPAPRAGAGVPLF